MARFSDFKSSEQISQVVSKCCVKISLLIIGSIVSIDFKLAKSLESEPKNRRISVFTDRDSHNF